VRRTSRAVASLEPVELLSIQDCFAGLLNIIGKGERVDAHGRVNLQAQNGGGAGKVARVDQIAKATRLRKRSPQRDEDEKVGMRQIGASTHTSRALADQFILKLLQPLQAACEIDFRHSPAC
jgi:hypothetical protein